MDNKAIKKEFLIFYNKNRHLEPLDAFRKFIKQGNIKSFPITFKALKEKTKTRTDTSAFNKLTRQLFQSIIMK